MKIKQNAQEFNSFALTELTQGKLLAILHALESLEKVGKISPLQEDILIFLRNNQSVYNG